MKGPAALDAGGQDHVLAPVQAADRGVPWIHFLGHGVKADAVFRRMLGLPGCLFLDSSVQTTAAGWHPCGRYSFVMADPYRWMRVDAGAFEDGIDPLQRLEHHLDELAAPAVAGLPPFQGGAAGLLSYELGRVWERLPVARHDEFALPWMVLGLYDVVVAFDHWHDSAWVISQGTPEKEPGLRRERAQRRGEQFLRWIERPQRPVTHGAPPSTPIPITAPTCAVRERRDIFSNFSASEYRAMVQQALDYIRAGDIFQVNLSQRLLARAREPASAVYLRLRERTQATFGAYFDAGEFQVVSASPERFVRVHDRSVEARPIKGTRRRTSQPEADLFAGDELLCSDKDRSENVMIVDLFRNDLSRVCRPDSVHVPQLCGLENYGYVQHLVSVVQGTLREDASSLDVLRAAFPGGSITGAPKVRAMEIIVELEQVARGAYCGSLGYIGYDGAMDWSILIRTLTAASGWWQFPVGGGIVTDSTPDAEYQETWHKAAGVLAALGR